MTTSALLRLVLAQLLLSKGADYTTKIKREESGGDVLTSYGNTFWEKTTEQSTFEKCVDIQKEIGYFEPVLLLLMKELENPGQAGRSIPLARKQLTFMELYKKERNLYSDETVQNFQAGLAGNHNVSQTNLNNFLIRVCRKHTKHKRKSNQNYGRLVEILIQAGADPNHTAMVQHIHGGRHQSQTPLQCAEYAAIYHSDLYRRKDNAPDSDARCIVLRNRHKISELQENGRQERSGLGQSSGETKTTTTTRQQQEEPTVVPVVVVNDSEANDNEENLCQICMDCPVYDASGCHFIVTPCGHIFACEACLNNLHRRGATCAICRANIESVQKSYPTVKPPSSRSSGSVGGRGLKTASVQLVEASSTMGLTVTRQQARAALDQSGQDLGEAGKALLIGCLGQVMPVALAASSALPLEPVETPPPIPNHLQESAARATARATMASRQRAIENSTRATSTKRRTKMNRGKKCAWKSCKCKSYNGDGANPCMTCKHGLMYHVK